MDYLKNHCWCSKSNWNNRHYDCQHIVSLSSYKEGYVDDWNSVIDPKSATIAVTPFDDDPEFTYTRDVVGLKSDVYQWLVDNVPDLKVDKFSNGTLKAWCIGSDEYRATDACSSFSIFFQRRRDAMAFIKRWSVHKKPIHYCQYFTDVRKQLNLDTGKYTIL